MIGLLAAAWACDAALEPVALADCLAGYEAEPTPEQAAAWALRLGTAEPDAAREFAEVALQTNLDQRPALLELCPECERTCPVTLPLDPLELQCLEWQADTAAGALLLKDARSNPTLWKQRADAHLERFPQDGDVLYQRTMVAVREADHAAVVTWSTRALEHVDRTDRLTTLHEERMASADALYYAARQAKGADHPEVVALDAQREAFRAELPKGR